MSEKEKQQQKDAASEVIEAFGALAWWMLTHLTRTLVWAGVFVWLWEPWAGGALGTRAVQAGLLVGAVLVLVPTLLWLFGRWVPGLRWVAWHLAPWGDVRRGPRGGLMRPVVEGFGLVDRQTGRRLAGVKTATDRERGVFTLAFPTGIRPETVESLDRLAVGEYAHLGACRHAVTLTRGRWVIIWHQQAAADPLAGVRRSQVGSPVPLGPVVMGRAADGTDAVLDLRDPAHIALQGQTRSGKSASLYTLLGSVAGMPTGAVTLWGIDPNAVLLSPWEARPDARVVLGAKPQEALELLTDACAEMDARIEQLRRLRVEAFDREHFGRDTSLLVIVLEEWPSLVRSAEAFDAGQKPADRVGGRIKAAQGRLLSEGAKAGIRLVLVAQRMDASIVGGAERAQTGTRMTLGVDNADAVRMLSPGASPELIERALLYTRGRCLWDQRGRPAVEVQMDLTDYATYLDAVERDLPGREGDD